MVLRLKAKVGEMERDFLCFLADNLKEITCVGALVRTSLKGNVKKLLPTICFLGGYFYFKVRNRSRENKGEIEGKEWTQDRNMPCVTFAYFTSE